MNRLLATALYALIALYGLCGLPPGGGVATPAWAASGSDSEDSINDAIEAQTEDAVTVEVESQVEDAVEASVEDTVEADVEDTVEADVEDTVESDVEDAVEADVEDAVEADVEDAVESDVEDAVESDVEGAVESDVEGALESDVEDSVESNVEDGIESEVEGDAEASVEQQLENDVEDELDGEAGVEREARDDTPGQADEDDRAGERGGPRTVKGSDASRELKSGTTLKAGHAFDRSASAASAAERFAGLDLDDEGNDISLGEWLVIASRDDIAELEALGYVTRAVESLEGLDRVLAYLEAPESFDIGKAQAAVRRAAPEAEVDYNHLYRPESKEQLHAEGGETPAELFPYLTTIDASSTRIGLIDTAIAPDHPALRGARVHERSFTPPDYRQPLQHGTSVLSILVGEAPGYRGLLPGAEVYAGAVFFIGPDGKEIATTASLVRALDWMTRSRVPVVNMSLAGPKNGILEAAINRAYETGTRVVAAVGNRGPTAPPLYPAAYAPVVAVTAVSSARKIYRLANRGAHVDFAAPGVDVLHADGEEGYRVSSGTSLAAPFVAAVIATSCAPVQPFATCMQALQRNAEDAGDAGFDPVFGNGIIRPLGAPLPRGAGAKPSRPANLSPIRTSSPP